MRHIVTVFDLINNPELAEQGVLIGEEVEIPEPMMTLEDMLGGGFDQGMSA